METAYSGKPEFYELLELEIEIITHRVSQGSNKVLPTGRNIQAMNNVDKEAFYDYILQPLRR